MGEQLVGNEREIDELDWAIGVRANFFLGGSAIFARKIFRQRPKNCCPNLQNFFAPLTLPSNY